MFDVYQSKLLINKATTMPISGLNTGIIFQHFP